MELRNLEPFKRSWKRALAQFEVHEKELRVKRQKKEEKKMIAEEL